MKGALHMLAAPLRAWIRMCRSRRESLSPVAKMALTLMMLPAFACLLILLRVAAALGFRMKTHARTKDGDRFICHPPDLIQMYLWLFDIWEPDLTDFIARRLKPGDGFIDVGANIGYYSVLAARCAGSGENVVAIEASPSVFAAVQETIALNPHAARVRAINKAASASPGTLNIYEGPRHNTGLTTTVAERGLPAQSSIEALPFDDLVTLKEIQAARLVKIDVEGGEPAVLAGMKRFLRTCCEDVEILLELSPNWWSDKTARPIDVLQPFIDAGFNVYQMENDYWPWRYLWPRCVKRPRRVRDDLTRRVDRMDLVLSKVDAEDL